MNDCGLCDITSYKLIYKVLEDTLVTTDQNPTPGLNQLNGKKIKRLHSNAVSFQNVRLFSEKDSQFKFKHCVYMLVNI